MFTRRATAAALALLATLSMSVISGISGIARADETLTGKRVTGGGQYTSDFFGVGTVAVHAVRHQDGTVTGQVEAHYPERGLRVHGEVDCLFVVGNRAYVSGVITNVEGDPDGLYYSEGTYFILAIQDDGEGHNSNPDLVSVLIPSVNPLDCTDPAAQNFADAFRSSLTHGNFQVVP